jgi:hypothetical protein
VKYTSPIFPPNAMPNLRFDLFANASDEEAARFRVLDGLQRIRKAFARNEVYPHLAELIRLHETLCGLIDSVAAVRDRHQGPLCGIDLENGRLVFDEPEEYPLLPDELARWALPRLAEAIDEGRTLYEFVDAHANFQAVGIVPAYQDEGYLIIPAGGRVRIFRYAMSLYDQPDGRYRSLRTSVVGEISTLVPSGEVKRQLVADFPELPNPATFRVDTDLDFPVEATVMPIAKRKLLQYLAVGGTTGAA